MQPMTFTEAIALAKLGAEVAEAFAELRDLPIGEIRRGNPTYERWRNLALRFNAMTDRRPPPWVGGFSVQPTSAI